MDDSLARMEAGQERAHHAEALRLRGWLANRRGDSESAQRFFRRAIAVARAQQAKSWELRAATSLAALLDQHGRRPEAAALLQAAYDQFAEGFDTRDLKAARLALDALR